MASLGHIAWTAKFLDPRLEKPTVCVRLWILVVDQRMQNAIESQFLNPAANPFNAEGRTGTPFSDVSRIIPLISYPRSRNGWIRCLIAAYLICRKERVSIQDVERLSIQKVTEGAAGIAVDGRVVYPIDLLVPDIYFFNNGSYTKLSTADSTNSCQSILSELNRLPVKTHHAAHSFDSFGTLSFLVRKPHEAIVSAGLLLCSHIATLSSQEVMDYAESLTTSYQRFMEVIVSQLGSRPTIVIDTENPYSGLIRLFATMGIRDVDVELFMAICKRFPVKSGYDKSSPLDEPVRLLSCEKDLDRYYELLRV